MNRANVEALIEKASSVELEMVWIPAIMKRQTEDEIESKETIEKNHIGLSGSDGPFITGLYNQIQKGEHLSLKQVMVVKKRLPKYSNQYLNIMEANGGKI